MTQKTIDLGGIKSSLDFHNKLSAELNFPSYYGKNWDAFWDMISNSVDLPNVIRFTNCGHAKKVLPKDWLKFQQCFYDLKNQYPNIKCDAVFVAGNGNKNPLDDVFEVINWLKIFASPVIIGVIISTLIWFNSESIYVRLMSVLILVLSIVIGIYFAESIRRTEGTQEFMATIYRTPELDKEEGIK
ncbi:MAG: barstar family protein [Bacteroidetes bacterium]|nr:barstar family protein [Bacteroidota bacterium]